ncbi:MAG: hypothetical protein WDW38_006112 [Sanguina aurantia]
MLRTLFGCFGRRDDQGLGSTYSIIKKVGYGVEGEVFLCEEKATGELVAIKTVPRGLQPAHQRMLTNEAIIHSQLAATNAAVVPIRELVLSHKCLGLVMEYMAGGTLQRFVESRQRLDEDMAAYLFRQVLLAVEKCHVHRVAYRDLKPDNCLLTADSPPRLKLCDFGVSKRWDKDSSSKMATIAGTPGYLCPEMLGKLLYGGSEYDAVKSDIWAMGALLSHMLLGHSPFYFEEVAEYAGMKGALQFAYEVESNSTWRHEAASRSDKVAKLDMSMISESAKQLLDILLDKNPEVRPSVFHIRAHPWVSRPLPAQYQSALDSMAKEQAALECPHARRPTPPDLPEQVSRLVQTASLRSTKQGRDLPVQRVPMQAVRGAAPSVLLLQQQLQQQQLQQLQQVDRGLAGGVAPGAGGEKAWTRESSQGWDEDDASVWSASQSVLASDPELPEPPRESVHGAQPTQQQQRQRQQQRQVPTSSPPRPQVHAQAQPVAPSRSPPHSPQRVQSSHSTAQQQQGQQGQQRRQRPASSTATCSGLRKGALVSQQRQEQPSGRATSMSLPGKDVSRQAAATHGVPQQPRRSSLSSRSQEPPQGARCQMARAHTAPTQRQQQVQQHTRQHMQRAPSDPTPHAPQRAHHRHPHHHNIHAQPQQQPKMQQQEQQQPKMQQQEQQQSKMQQQEQQQRQRPQGEETASSLGVPMHVEADRREGDVTQPPSCARKLAGDQDCGVEAALAQGSPRGKGRLGMRCSIVAE